MSSSRRANGGGGGGRGGGGSRSGKKAASATVTADGTKKNNSYRKPQMQAPFQLPEARRIELEEILQQFKAECDNTADALEYVFPSSLTNEERRFLHLSSNLYGFITQSYGTGEDRHITIRKRTGDTEANETIALQPESLITLENFMKQYGPCQSSSSGSDVGERGLDGTAAIGKTHHYPRLAKIVPPTPSPNKLITQTQKSLPVYALKAKILETIRETKFPVFIQGTTGCGKSTQIPQYLLEEAAQNRQPINIICTVPRRVAAISICDRVAYERGESVGKTVGYKIRLENQSSPTETALTFCTGGILLRSLADPTFLQDVTHLILDEVHERDKFTDFVLGYLKRGLSSYPNLRIVLMGASIDLKVFSNFFGMSCPILNVEGRVYPVEVHWLGEVLRLTGYTAEFARRPGKRNEPLLAASRSVVPTKPVKPPGASDEELKELLMDVLASTDAANTFSANKLLKMVKFGLVDPNYSHPATGLSITAVFFLRGLHEHMAELLEFCTNEMPPNDLPSGVAAKPVVVVNGITSTSTQGKPEEEDPLVTSYLKTISIERVDTLLIFKLIKKIHTTKADSYGILVFLPGFEDMITLKYLILKDQGMMSTAAGGVGVGVGGSNKKSPFQLYMLHSTIEADQRAVFRKEAAGVRKIILSTNIAETSLTIDGVGYVIDSGKVKEKTYDAQTHCSMLVSTWISKASAQQRKGRAGRSHPGVCYRLYTQTRFLRMDEFQVSEIVRTLLDELCLHCKVFLPKEIGIAQFFENVPEPPSRIAIEDSINVLKQMNALHDDESLTRLGKALVKFPMEPALAKILIYAVVLRCVDPVLTIVSGNCYRDPFQLPIGNADKVMAQDCKRKFTGDSHSDHIALLKAFEGWDRCTTSQAQESFCSQNFLSHSSLRMIRGIRRQLRDSIRQTVLKSYTTIDWHYFNVNSWNWSIIKSALTVGLYPNICKVHSSRGHLFNKIEKKIKFHHLSTVLPSNFTNNIQLPSDWVIFNEMSRNPNSAIVQECTVISRCTVALFAGSDSCRIEKINSSIFALKVGDWITLEGSPPVLNWILGLRNHFSSTVQRFLTSGIYDKMSVEVINAVVAVLTHEGIQYPSLISSIQSVVVGRITQMPHQQIPPLLQVQVSTAVPPADDEESLARASRGRGYGRLLRRRQRQ